MKCFVRALKILGGIVGAIALALAIWIGPMVWPKPQVYGTIPPHLPASLTSPAFLVFSKTNGFRDDASIQAGNAALVEIAHKRGWGVFVTENSAVFNPALLARFNTVIWDSTSGDVLTPDQRRAFSDYLEHGGSFIGIHGAGGDMQYRWGWYVQNLIGAQFTGHTIWPHLQTATITIADPSHPAMAGLPGQWVTRDEWYSFDTSVRARGYRVLATLNEASYQPRGLLFNDIAMHGEHPLIWSHCVGRGRAFYSALGHAPASFSIPLHRRLLENAMAWSLAPGDCRDGV